MAKEKIELEVSAEVKAAEKKLAKIEEKLEKQNSTLDSLSNQYKKIQQEREKALNPKGIESEIKALEKKQKLLKEEQKMLSESNPNFMKAAKFAHGNPNTGLVKMNLNKWGVKQEDVDKYWELGTQINKTGFNLSEKRSAYYGAKSELNTPSVEQQKIQEQISKGELKSNALAEQWQLANQELESLKKSTGELTDETGKVLTPISRFKVIADGLAKGTFERLLQVAKSTGRWILRAFSASAIKVFKKAVLGLIAPFKKLNKSVEGFGKRLKTAILQGLIFRPLRNALSKITEGFVAALRQSNEFTSSLGNLKGAVFTAITPAIEALIPIVAKLMNFLAMAITYLSTFINMLFGLKKASKSAAKATGDAIQGTEGSDKNNFASWDTIQQLDKGDGGAGGHTPATYDQDFTEAEGALAKIKELMLADDWYGVGMEISRMLNDIITQMNSWLTGTFVPFMSEFGTNFGNLLNGIFDGLDEAKVGAMLANFFNGIVYAFTNFFTTFDMTKMASSFGATINSFFANFNIESLAVGISAFITGIFNSISTFFETVDWKMVGEKVRLGLASIDWLGIVVSVIDAALSVGEGILDGIIGLFDLTWGDLATDILAVATAFGALKIAANLDVIRDGLANLIIKASDLWDVINTKFGGITLIITGAMMAVNNFVEMFKKGFSWIKEILMVIGIALAAVGAVILGIPATVAAVIAAIVAAVATAVVLIKEHWDSIKEWFVELWNKVKEIAVKAWDAIKQAVKDKIAQIKTIFLTIKEIAKEVWNKVKEVFANIPEWFKTKFTSARDKIKTVFGSLTTFFSTLWSNIKSKFSSFGTAIANTLGGAIKAVINGVISLVENRINFAINLINSAIGIINKIPSVNVGKINKLSLPRLAQGAVVNPSHEFAAILGDNRHEQEIVSPLSTMKQALLEALQESGAVGANRDIILTIDGKKLARVTAPYYNGYNKKLGANVI